MRLLALAAICLLLAGSAGAKPRNEHCSLTGSCSEALVAEEEQEELKYFAVWPLRFDRKEGWDYDPAMFGMKLPRSVVLRHLDNTRAEIRFVGSKHDEREALVVAKNAIAKQDGLVVMRPLDSEMQMASLDFYIGAKRGAFVFRTLLPLSSRYSMLVADVSVFGNQSEARVLEVEAMLRSCWIKRE